MSVLPVPRDIQGVSAEWIASALAAAGRLPADAGPVAWRARPVGVDRGYTGTLARIEWSSGAASGALIAKFPDAVDHGERSCREVRFYRELAASAGLSVPALLHAETSDAEREVVLLLEEIEGRDGDVLLGAAPGETRAVLRALAAMHGRWWRSPNLDRLAWLPRWGAGTAGADRPHRRRAERFRGRIEPFFARWGHGSDPFAELVRGLAPRAEDLLASLATLPPTLIHGDVHLDNLIFTGRAGNADAVLLDWQSVSAGPAVYDLARFLCESAPDDAAIAAIPRHLDRYVADLVDSGVPDEEARTAPRDFRRMLPAVIIGFISGYGRRDPEEMTARERAMVDRSLSPAGLAGAVLALAPDEFGRLE